MIFDIPHLHSNNSNQIREDIHYIDLLSINIPIMVVESQYDISLSQQGKHIFLCLAEKRYLTDIVIKKVNLLNFEHAFIIGWIEGNLNFWNVTEDDQGNCDDVVGLLGEIQVHDEEAHGSTDWVYQNVLYVDVCLFKDAEESKINWYEVCQANAKHHVFLKHSDLEVLDFLCSFVCIWFTLVSWFISALLVFFEFYSCLLFFLRAYAFLVFIFKFKVH